MLNTRETSSEVENVSGGSSGQSWEKSNFAQTCSLLRRYLKQKSFTGDPSHEVTRILQSKAPPTAMNFPVDEDAGKNGVSVPLSNLKPMNLFPQIAGFRCSDDIGTVDGESHFSFPPADVKSQASSASPKMEPMTIFYDGGVVACDNFPGDTARKIMALVGKRWLKKPAQECGEAADQYEVPIARRNSLHRFLAKRKDRSGTARAPYQIAMNRNPISNALSDMEAEPSEHLELRL